MRQVQSQPLLAFTPLPAFVYAAYVEEPTNTLSDMTNANETRTRRRILPNQLECLEALYAKSTHPSRQARQQVALETGMCVVWQNSCTPWDSN